MILTKLFGILPMFDAPRAVFVVHEGFSLFGYGVARDLIRMAADASETVKLDVVTASATAGQVKSSCGAAVVADCDLSVLPQAHYVFICSSRKQHPDEDDDALARGLRYCHRHGGWVIGLGTGVSALAQAGLLTGRRAAAHPAQLSLLQSKFSKTVFTFAPYILDQRVATTVGGDGVTDMMLELLSQSYGDGIAENVRRAVMLKPGRSVSLLASVGLQCSIDELDTRLSRYIQIIEHSIAAPMSLDYMARAIAVSPRTLARLTHHSFGCAPGELSTRIRLNCAADLLRTTSKSIQDIAEASGYRSAAHFSESFNKRFSVRPGKFRSVR
ncbi:helix-turn-helix domain-containing protein [Pseudophaeobacter sp.]|uniref:GlxA family transcriptional regulator n=1 Tax=Pseudophaeobacter sp. TaxID=1971739 RepID=UPI003296A289